MKEFVFSVIKWFTGLTGEKALIALMAIIICGFGWYYIGTEKERELRDQERETVIAEMQAELKECSKVRTEFLTLKNDFILIRASQDQIPMPRWIKNVDFKMIWVNKAYEAKYLLPRGLTATEYISNYDEYAFDQTTVNQFRANDRLVLSLNRPLTFTEMINGEAVEVVKYPFRIGETTFGIGGIEIQSFN